MGQPPRRTVWQLLRKLNILSPRDPGIVLLGIYPKELKAYVHTKACIRIHRAAVSTGAKSCVSFNMWMDSRGPSRQWLTDQGSEEMSYQAVKRHGSIFNAC